MATATNKVKQLQEKYRIEAVDKMETEYGNKVETPPQIYFTTLSKLVDNKGKIELKEGQRYRKSVESGFHASLNLQVTSCASASLHFTFLLFFCQALTVTQKLPFVALHLMQLDDKAVAVESVYTDIKNLRETAFEEAKTYITPRPVDVDEHELYMRKLAVKYVVTIQHSISCYISLIITRSILPCRLEAEKAAIQAERNARTSSSSDA